MNHSLAALAILALPLPAAAADLTVHLTHVAPDEGPARVLLFAGPEGFRHEDKASRREQVPASGEQVSVTFRNLPPGRYAVMAYQDSNNDDKLDLRLGMFPKEPWGLSNDPRMMGPPTFAASAFDVTRDDKAIDIPIHH
ncbi:DUF2141 domain-containing protein [Sphingomonas oryzagri]